MQRLPPDLAGPVTVNLVDQAAASGLWQQWQREN
jgi:hypothetical protein